MNTTMSGPDAFCTEAPVPHASVSPTPRSHTRMLRWSLPGPITTNSTLRPCHSAACLAMRTFARSSTSTTVCMLVVTDATVMMAAHSHPIQPHQFRPDDRSGGQGRDGAL